MPHVFCSTSILQDITLTFKPRFVLVFSFNKQPLFPREASVSCKRLLSRWICKSQTTYGIYFHILYTPKAQFFQQAYL